MLRPQVLALGRYAPNDLVVTLSASNRAIDPTIEDQLDAVWEAKVQKAKEEGRTIYNGLSYRLNAFEEREGKLCVDFGIIEYKVRDGLIAVPGFFDLPEPYYRKGCYTGASVKTSDGYYLMAELSGKSMNMNAIDLLGGIMETEPACNTGADIFASLYKELEEEALISERDIADSYLRALYLEHRTNVCFYFEVTLKISSEEILKRFEHASSDQDIRSIKIFKKEDYLAILQAHNPNKQLIGELLLV